MGKVVLSFDKSVITDDMQIGSKLPSGVYIIKVIAEEGTDTYKVIKK